VVADSERCVLHSYPDIDDNVCCRFIGEMTLSAIRGNTRPVDVIQITVNISFAALTIVNCSIPQQYQAEDCLRLFVQSVR